MNDKELLMLLKSDSERGLAQVIGQYGAYVHKVAYTRLRDVCSREDIEEAVSDVFLMFYNTGKKTSFDMRSVQAVLSVIAKRHCINIFRKQCRHEKTVGYDDLENIIADDESDNTDLIEAIKQLGEPDSLIIIRKYYLGQKNIEIAKDLGMNISTLNMKISRGLKKLKKILEEGM
ncbi:MAG: sigma-70 family RNA polymerase sigma factor [Ruminococcus sp.]|nr:sigma-70 family RNA polymerase sigma factor [Ruminococcus sp.]